MGRMVLMVAFHFPPAAMGSGHLRTLGFARYLPEFGWDPVVLSARALAYPCTAPVDKDSIPCGCEVHRALAFDVSRHFSAHGRYPGFLAQPDRWSSWFPAAVWQGWRQLRHHKVRAIWSTYPIMTAHCIARTLSRISGLPWIADFRDPVASSVEAGNPYSVASQHRWESRVLGEARQVVFTTPGALEACAVQYPEAATLGRLQVIGNGYDESAFANLTGVPPPLGSRPLVLLHSGVLYRDGRNPLPFLAAIARLKALGRLGPTGLRVVLRGSRSEAVYAEEIRRLGLTDVVTLAASVSGREALAEQATADGLLLFQGNLFDRQIPAKLYEYLRIGRPIFALVGTHGDTAQLLRETGGAQLTSPDNVDVIAGDLHKFVCAIVNGTAPCAQPVVAARYSRRKGAARLAALLDSVAD